MNEVFAGIRSRHFGLSGLDGKSIEFQKKTKTENMYKIVTLDSKERFWIAIGYPRKVHGYDI